MSFKTCPKWYRRWQYLHIWHPHCRLTYFKWSHGRRRRLSGGPITVLAPHSHLSEEIRSYSWVWPPCSLEVRGAFQYELSQSSQFVCIFRWSRNWYKPNNFLNPFQLHKTRGRAGWGRGVVWCWMKERQRVSKYLEDWLFLFHQNLNEKNGEVSVFCYHPMWNLGQCCHYPWVPFCRFPFLLVWEKRKRKK